MAISELRRWGGGRLTSREVGLKDEMKLDSIKSSPSADRVDPHARAGELDLLRLFAALSVVLFHYTFSGFAADDMSTLAFPAIAPVAQYGYLGVHLFFMISGFVILMSASEGNIARFIAARAGRLYPAFWACCSISYLASLAIGGARFHGNFMQYLANMGLISGFVGIPAIDGAYWSLFVEIKLYALVVLAMLTRQYKRVDLLLLGWFIAVAYLQLHSDTSVNQMLLASPFFISGALYYQIWTRGVSVVRLTGAIGCWALAALYAAQTSISMDRYYHAAFSPLVIAIIFAAFHLVLFLVATRRTGLIARGNWMLAGAITYPLYLIHQNLGFMIFNLASGFLNPYAILVMTIAFMGAIALLINRLVERPLMAILRRYILLVIQWVYGVVMDRFTALGNGWGR
jgi:peptidoglycan/LPS O-acetylase OafA/YrhL